MSKIITLKKIRNATFAGVVSVAAAPSFAEGTTADAIKAAVASGQSSVQLTVAGVIGLAALGFGVGMIISYLRR